MAVISPVNTENRAGLGLKAGDTVRVWTKIQEKDKTKLQAFEGLVLAVKHGKEAGATFTVRRTSGGVGVEKIFPLYSPMIDKIEITKRAKIRRAKLYHIRDKAMKDVKRQMRNIQFVDISTSNEVEASEAQADSQSEEAVVSEPAAEEATQETSATEPASAKASAGKEVAEKSE